MRQRGHPGDLPARRVRQRLGQHDPAGPAERGPPGCARAGYHGGQRVQRGVVGPGAGQPVPGGPPAQGDGLAGVFPPPGEVSRYTDT